MNEEQKRDTLRLNGVAAERSKRSAEEILRSRSVIDTRSTQPVNDGIKPAFVKCRTDVTVKFNEIPPNPKESGGAVKVTVEDECGVRFVFSVKSKSWRKFLAAVDAILAANPDAEWIASAGGKLAGKQDGRHLLLEGVGIQVFEKKPKPQQA